VRTPAGAYAYTPGEAELRWMNETSTYFLATGESTGGGFTLVDGRSRREAVPRPEASDHRSP
jgi:hypothetical protein